MRTTGLLHGLVVSFALAPAAAQAPPVPPSPSPNPQVGSGEMPPPPLPVPAPEPLVEPQPAPLPAPHPAPLQPAPPPWSPPPYGWPAVPEPAPRPEDEPGVRDGLPYALVGALALETAAYTNGDEITAAAIALGARIPLVDSVFFVGRVPLGIVVAGNDSSPILGNPTLGVGGVADIGDRVWLSLDGRLGLPLVSEAAVDDEIAIIGPMIPRALWNMHEYYPNVFPVVIHAGVEGHAGSLVILRAMLEPVLLPPFEVGERSRDDAQFELVLQHAAEIQLGHFVGGGLRIQGVALPTFDETTYRILEQDLYQFAFEPFFAIQHDEVFARFGLVMPADEALGPPFKGTWGARFDLGLPF
jgi:hypothetical protein